MIPETGKETTEGGLPIRDLFAFAGVRAIIGDPHGKLMQDEVADRIQKLVNVLRETVGVMDSLDIMRSHPSLTAGERKMMTLAMREIREALDSGMPEWDAVCKAIHEANVSSAPTGAPAAEPEQEAARPLGDAACSLIFSLLEHLVRELDETLCPTGYARCQEITDRKTQYTGKKWDGWRIYRLDFGHFYIDIASDGQDPTPHILAVAEEHCTPDEFLGRIRDGLGAHHRPHEGAVSIRHDFTKYARSIREGFVCLSKDEPPAPTGIAVGLNDFADLK